MSRFIPNQVVWAKVKGYPWWPAMILKVKEHKNEDSMADILVNFIGENSHATLPEDKINDFDEKFKQFSTGKGKKFQDSIKLAMSMIEENLAYEESLKKAAAPKTKHVQPASKAHKSNEGQKKEGPRRKESPHDFETMKEERPGRKPKGKEDKKSLVYDHLLDFIPHRVTRSQLKSQHIEVPTEPLIYGSRKPAHPVAKNNKNKSQTDEMEVESTKAYGGDSRKASGDYPFIKLKVNNDPDETKMGSTSPADTFDGSISNGSQRHAGRTSAKKAVTSRDNKNKKVIVSQFQNSESVGNGESKHLIEDRSATLNEEDINLMPRIIKEQNNTTDCCNGSILEHSEHQLNEIMNKFTNKFKNNEIVIEQDEDIIKLLSVIENFQKHDLKGSELISSNIGKLFKTIHYILIKNKHALHKAGNAVISVLARILHQIKDRILKYCLDNTGYVESLHLPVEKNELSLSATIMIPPIEIDEIKTKIEELTSESDHKGIIILDDPLSMTTRVDDEELPERASKDQFHVSKGQTISNLHDIPALSMKHIVSSPCKQNNSKDACSNNNKSQCQSHHGITFVLRKKACQKIAKMIQESYKLEKDKSQELTLVLEGKIYVLYQDLADDYKETIKNVYKLLKLKLLSVDELISMKELNGNAFELVLKNKLAYLSEADRTRKDSLDGTEILTLTRNDSRNSTTFSFTTEILENQAHKSLYFESVLAGRCNGFLSESPKKESNGTSNDFVIPPSHNFNSGKKNENSIIN